MTAKGARDARTPPRALWVVGGVVVLVAGFLLFRSGGDGASAPAADRPAASGDAPEANARAKGGPARAPGARPTNDDADEDDAEDAPRGDVGRGAPPVASAEGPADDPLKPVRQAMADPSDEGTRALVARLSSTDDVVVAEAANALVERKAFDTIPWIAKIDLKTAAGSGLSIIDALGRLGAIADSGGRTAAVDRLLAMLAEERARGARESPANLLQIYEALGKLGDPRARTALEAELLDPGVPRAPKVVIVKSLVKIGQPESRAALTAARAQQASQKGEDDFEEEIRVELVGEIDKALQEL